MVPEYFEDTNACLSQVLHNEQDAKSGLGHQKLCVCCRMALEPNSGYLRRLVFFANPSQQSDVESIAAASTLMLTCHDGAGAS